MSKSNFFVSFDVKEQRGRHLVKVDKFSGDVNSAVSFLVDKYGARIPSRLKRVFDLVGQELSDGKES